MIELYKFHLQHLKLMFQGLKDNAMPIYSNLPSIAKNDEVGPRLSI